MTLGITSSCRLSMNMKGMTLSRLECNDAEQDVGRVGEWDVLNQPPCLLHSVGSPFLFFSSTHPTRSLLFVPVERLHHGPSIGLLFKSCLSCCPSLGHSPSAGFTFPDSLRRFLFLVTFPGSPSRAERFLHLLLIHISLPYPLSSSSFPDQLMRFSSLACSNPAN